MLVETTRADIESLKADLAAAENALVDTRLTAPFNGVVNRKYTENHETVSPGMPVVSLLDVSSLEAATAVPEDMVIRASDFKQILVTLDAHPGLKITGTLKEIGRQTGNTNQSYPLTAVLDVPEGLSVEPGMAATVHLSIFSGTSENEGMSLPTAAVFADAEGRSSVWRLTESMKTEKVPVKTGALKGDDIQILSGVSPGDRVISAGARFLVEGQTVRVLDGNGEGES
jgi:RND family efflux transporter MFP subunit